jgi:hypothetical protein
MSSHIDSEVLRHLGNGLFAVIPASTGVVAGGGRMPANMLTVSVLKYDPAPLEVDESTGR